MHSRQSKRKAALQTMILPAKRCAIMKCRIDNDKGEKTSHTESTSIEFEQVSDDHVDSSEDSEAPFSSVVYHVGDRVDGFYQGFRGPRMFFPGHITAVHPDSTYDIEYDDGDKETHVAAGFIRFYEDDHEEVDNGATNEDHLTSSVSGTSFDEFELARIVRSQMILSMVFVWVFLSLSLSLSLPLPLPLNTYMILSTGRYRAERRTHKTSTTTRMESRQVVSQTCTTES